MADQTAAAVRAYAREHGLTVPAARQRLIAAALFLDTADRSDQAVIDAFLAGCRHEQQRAIDALVTHRYPGAVSVADVEAYARRQDELAAAADAAIEAYQSTTRGGPLRLVHSVR